MLYRKSILVVIAIIFISKGNLYSQKNNVSVTGTSIFHVSSISISYEHDIDFFSSLDLKGIVFVGNVRSHLLQWSHEGHELNGGFGGIGVSMIRQYRKSTKWEVGIKFFRLNSGSVEKTFFPSANLGLRWDVNNVLIKTGIESIAGLYLSGGYRF